MQVNSIIKYYKYNKNVILANTSILQIFYIAPGLKIYNTHKNTQNKGEFMKAKVINIKLDAETKSKIESLAYLKRKSIQDLCKELIDDCIEANADKIAEAEKLRE